MECPKLHPVPVMDKSIALAAACLAFAGIASAQYAPVVVEPGVVVPSH